MSRIASHDRVDKTIPPFPTVGNPSCDIREKRGCALAGEIATQDDFRNSKTAKMDISSLQIADKDELNDTFADRIYINTRLGYIFYVWPALVPHIPKINM